MKFLRFTLKSVGLTGILRALHLYLSVIYNSLHKHVIGVDPPNLDWVWAAIVISAVLFAAADIFQKD